VDIAREIPGVDGIETADMPYRLFRQAFSPVLMGLSSARICYFHWTPRKPNQSQQRPPINKAVLGYRIAVLCVMKYRLAAPAAAATIADCRHEHSRKGISVPEC
jgi:hypothetical protein